MVGTGWVMEVAEEMEESQVKRTEVVGGIGGRDGGEDRFEDQLRSFPIKLPVLPEPSMKMASLEAGDWLTQVKPLISDVSGKAGKWWDGVITRVTQVYLQWLEASPLERLKISAPMMTAEEEGSVRLAQRVTTMLLEAVPQTLVIVNLDILHGGDLLKNPHLPGWLQSMAKRGKVSVWTAGPPCRSVSWCRYREEDGGPPPLRTREGGERFGLEGLEEWYQEQVQGDTVMFLRTLSWFRLSGEANKQTQFALEQPMDPQEWVTKEKLPKGGAPSFMVWKETRETMKALGLKMTRMDQGALGHQTRKPTMVATNMMEVEQLNGIKSDSYALQKAWQGDFRGWKRSRRTRDEVWHGRGVHSAHQW